VDELAVFDDVLLALQADMAMLLRRFHRATGNSPREYIQRVRVEAAKRLLEGGNLAIGEIAGRVGYGDVVAFRKVFVRCAGITPGDYRVRYGARTAPSWVAAARSAS